MSVKAAIKARHEAFQALEQAQKNYRLADEALTEAKKAAKQQQNLDFVLAKLSKAERKRYRSNLELADKLIATWTEQEAIEWYVCQRKILYFKYEEALEASLHDEKLNPYICIYCTGYHNGHGGQHTNALPSAKYFKWVMLDAIHKTYPYKDSQQKEK